MNILNENLTMKKLFFVFLLGLFTSSGFAQLSNEELKAKYHQFDFWIGDWEVYQYGTDSLSGISKIETIIDGIGLLENYHTTTGTYKGKSLNKFNPSSQKWEQYWIDNSELTLYLLGTFEEGKMTLSDQNFVDPEKGWNKIVWEQNSDRTVRQTWSISQDKGKTWTVIFDGEYRPRKGN